MDIQYISPTELIPYSKNAKRHPAEQVKMIAKSIKEFGFQQPIVIDKDNVVVIGHGRLLASKRLKLSEVPVVRVEGLSDEQVRALRLADNSVSESEWNLDLLAEEIADIDIDMGDFGTNLDLSEDDFESDDDSADSFAGMLPRLQHNVFENQERRQFYAENYYGIPEMYPTQTTGDQMLRFMDFLEVDDPENYIAHFYYDDFKFMAAWRNPDKYIERLQRFKAVISPNFSLYTDFPVALQILSCYRRQRCGAYWQGLGIDVIPNVNWGDRKSFAFCFLGIPKGGVVSVSAVDIIRDPMWNGKEGTMFKDGYDEMMNRLEPTAILYYGTLLPGLEGNIIHCPSYYEQKRAILNKQKKIKEGKK